MIICFVLGLIWGSFANVYFFRIPEELSPVSPRSFCPSCKKNIPWHDNLPILSYLILRGKCRSCNSKISIQYPLIEFATAILFASIYLKFSSESFYVIGSLILFSFFIFLIGGVDLATYFKLNKEYGIIPDHLTYPLIALGLIFAWFNPLLDAGITTAILSATATASGLYVFRWVAGLLLKKEALGLGDVKMLAGVAMWLGWRGAVLTLLVGSILGTVISLTLIFSKKLTRKSSIPFGPFLSAGALSALFFV